MAVVAAMVVSPVLAGWTVGLTTDIGPDSRWWQPRPVSTRRVVLVAALAAVMAAVVTGGTPVLAWWLFAVGGAVLCITDVEHHLLPARLVYPLAAGVAAVLAVDAVMAGAPDRPLRAVFAAVMVCGAWFTVAFLAPSAMGLGDVRVAALAAGLLGWTGWPAVLQGQLAAFGLAAVSAGIIAATSAGRAWSVQVPIGPALILGALAVNLL